MKPGTRKDRKCKLYSLFVDKLLVLLPLVCAQLLRNSCRDLRGHLKVALFSKTVRFTIKHT